ncbi:MAG: FemAB family PEP-CTERM system-associated protein [Candidatus Thiodiazotropha sp. (ex Cardiolucina cf. quadrata)]|nr:FemAB family PEP-CTERM system-associated protein [Candidatus Thiodiazotropha sp. (ex Cardiolucina cf. quadrata)]
MNLFGYEKEIDVEYSKIKYRHTGILHKHGHEMINKNISVKIYNTNEENSNKWNGYLKTNDQACLYQLFEWQIINNGYFNHSVYNIVAEINNQIVGVLPLVSLKSVIFGHILCSMPFVNYGSSCANSTEIDKKLMEYACELTNKIGAKYLEVRSQKPSVINMKESKNKISLTIKLVDDYDTLWNGFKSKHRTNIRRVYKNGITVKKGGDELLKPFYEILSKSWRDLGTPIYSIKYFKKITQYFKSDYTIFIAYKDGTPVAAAFNGYYKDIVEGMWLGLDNQYRQYQPSYVLYWEMIKDACERGYKTYHLGRSSTDSGGESFKKKWNADTKQLYWQYHLNSIEEMPNLNPSNPKYKLLIKIWRILPLKVTQIIGPLISKNIP